MYRREIKVRADREARAQPPLCKSALIREQAESRFTVVGWRMMMPSAVGRKRRARSVTRHRAIPRLSGSHSCCDCRIRTRLWVWANSGALRLPATNFHQPNQRTMLAEGTSLVRLRPSLASRAAPLPHSGHHHTRSHGYRVSLCVPRIMTHSVRTIRLTLRGTFEGP